MRFACAGDGLCCTDVHLLGPVTRAEQAPIERVRPLAIVRGRHLAVLAPEPNGHCTFLSVAPFSEQLRCSIHDPRLQPRSCARYPFLLAATPAGGRIGTDHRCPCRTMGERPLLAVEDAIPSIVDRAGRLSADRHIGDRIAITRARRVSFARYEAIEHELLGRIEDAESLRARSWPSLVMRLDEIAIAPTRWAATHAAFARGLEAVATRGEAAPFARPWAASFVRAAARSDVEIEPESMLADWAADVIWSLEWALAMSLAEAQREIAWRAEIARALARGIDARRDAAMAEAIAIVEVAGLSPEWGEFARG